MLEFNHDDSDIERMLAIGYQAVLVAMLNVGGEFLARRVGARYECGSRHLTANLPAFDTAPDQSNQ